MKKILIMGIVLGGTVGAFAQGSIDMSQQAGSFIMQIYGPNTANPAMSISGNTTTDVPSGSTVYTGCPLLGGGSSGAGTAGTTTPPNYSNGHNFDFEFFETPGANAGSATTEMTGSLVTFNTSPAHAGQWLAPASDPQLPGTVAGGSATLQGRAWYNEGGTVSTWALAVSAGVPMGESALFNSPLGGTPVGGGSPIQDPFPTNMQAFNIQSVPEPCTIALGIMGASAFLIRRRK